MDSIYITWQFRLNQQYSLYSVWIFIYERSLYDVTFQPSPPSSTTKTDLKQQRNSCGLPYVFCWPILYIFQWGVFWFCCSSLYWFFQTFSVYFVLLYHIFYTFFDLKLQQFITLTTETNTLQLEWQETQCWIRTVEKIWTSPSTLTCERYNKFKVGEQSGPLFLEL